jgi:hypothetical protein
MQISASYHFTLNTLRQTASIIEISKNENVESVRQPAVPNPFWPSFPPPNEFSHVHGFLFPLQ